MRLSPIALLPAVALLAACGDSTGPDGGSQSRTERFTWSGQVAAGGTVEIRNINGAVRARRGAGPVRVQALKEGGKDHPSSVRIEVIESAQGVTVCAVYPDVPGLPPNRCVPGMGADLSSRANDVSVTFDIELPAGVAFTGVTIAGDVEATGLAGHVRASTLAGDIDISTSATAEATTINGDITAAIGAFAWDRDLSFTAMSGHVTVRIPAQANAVVNGSTLDGSIATDFALRITRLGDWQRLSGTLGSGGRNLNIATTSGNIALLTNHGQPPPGANPGQSR